MSKGLEPQIITDAVHGTISAVQKYTPWVVQRQALKAGAEIGSTLFPAAAAKAAERQDREAGG